jgi:hypothetical protein
MRLEGLGKLYYPSLSSTCQLVVLGSFLREHTPCIQEVVKIFQNLLVLYVTKSDISEEGSYILMRTTLLSKRNIL